MSFTVPPGGGAIENPEIGLPFTFDIPNGSVGLVEQGSDVDITNRIWIALSYEPGQLVAIPEFGIPSQAFKKGGADLDLIDTVITRWIPEAHEIIDRDPNWFETLVDTITVRRDLING